MKHLYNHNCCNCCDEYLDLRSTERAFSVNHFLPNGTQSLITMQWGSEYLPFDYRTYLEVGFIMDLDKMAAILSRTIQNPNLFVQILNGFLKSEPTPFEY